MPLLLLAFAFLFLLGVIIGWWLRARHNKQEEQTISAIMNAQFRNLATEILEEKTRYIGQKSEEQLGHVLSPFKENLESFRKRVEEIHTTQAEQSGRLKQHLEQLAQLNHQLSTDAQNLASALQGKAQRRGAWGELILERTLELSGLERGREFEMQVSTPERLRPDAIIFLPEERLVIVDSKVSLIDYQRACNATTEQERGEALTRHAAAVRTHVKALSEKKYPGLFEGKTQEMTMMFLPIEPAFGAALTANPQLFEFAFAHRIILVTPSTLLAALKTIHHFWKIEKQTKNVLEIARLGGMLHDRFVDFSNHLLTARAQIAKALTTQEEAIARLSSQKGNLINTAERLHQLGAKTKKKIARELLDYSSEKK